MKARIYKPGKSTMQSGRAHLSKWIVEYESQTAKEPEALMGWVSAGDTLSQIRVPFDTFEAAEKYAQEKRLDYTVITSTERRVKPRNYSDNFKYTPPKPTAKKATSKKTAPKKSTIAAKSTGKPKTTAKKTTGKK